MRTATPTRHGPRALLSAILQAAVARTVSAPTTISGGPRRRRRPADRAFVFSDLSRAINRRDGPGQNLSGDRAAVSDLARHFVKCARTRAAAGTPGAELLLRPVPVRGPRPSRAAVRAMCPAPASPTSWPGGEADSARHLLRQWRHGRDEDLATGGLGCGGTGGVR